MSKDVSKKVDIDLKEFLEEVEDAIDYIVFDRDSSKIPEVMYLIKKFVLERDRNCDCDGHV
jgi:hypothetical protein